jgi:hypothetical protein
MCARLADAGGMTRKFRKEYRKWVWKSINRKNVYVVLGDQDNAMSLVGDCAITAVSSCKYLGRVASGRGGNEEEIKSRIGQGNKAKELLQSLIWKQ